jgi:predicted phosphoribosyltransferase
MSLLFSKRLKEPLDVVRKLGLPDRSELAIGAIASGGVRVSCQIPELAIDVVAA